VEGAAGSVEELAETRAVEVILNIAVVGVVEGIEDSEPNPRMLLPDGEANPAPDLQVGRNESRKSQFISRSHELAVLIDR